MIFLGATAKGKRNLSCRGRENWTHKSAENITFLRAEVEILGLFCQRNEYFKDFICLLQSYVWTLIFLSLRSLIVYISVINEAILLKFGMHINYLSINQIVFKLFFYLL